MTDDPEPKTQSPDAPRPESGDSGAAPVSPGHLLRSARERNELSVDDLTARTLLSRPTVAALEDNRFDLLPQPVFVRGYYRKCAKVLAMSESELLDSYGQWADQAMAQPASSEQVDVVPQDVTPDRWRALGLVGVVVLVLFAAVFAWAWLPGLVGSESDSNGSAEPATREAASVAPAAGDSDASANDGYSAGNNAAPVEPAPSEPDEAPDEAPDAAPASDGDARAPADNADPADSADTDTGAAGTESAADEAAVEGKLTLRFRERSWVRVRDADGATLLGGIVKGGNLRVVEGNPPYDVSLGYAPGVSVKMGERAVDLSDRIADDDTAEFTVQAGNP